MIDLGTTQKSKLSVIDGPGWVKLGAVPAADAIAKAKGNSKDDIVAQVGRDVYVASSKHLGGPAAAGSAIELTLPGGESLAGAIVYVDREGPALPPEPRPRWKQNVANVGMGAMLLGFGAVIASTCGLIAASFGIPAFILGGAGFLAVGLATDMQL